MYLFKFFIFFLPSMAQNYTPLMNLELRRNELSKFSETQVHHWCKSLLANKIYSPILEFNGGADGYNSDGSAENFSLEMSKLSAYAIASHEPKVIRAAIQNLLHWSNTDAIRVFRVDPKDKSYSNAYYSARRAFLPILVLWSVIRSQAQKAERKKISDWIHRVLVRLDVSTGHKINAFNDSDCLRRDMRSKYLAISNCNNQRALRESVNILGAFLENDDKRWQKSLAAFDLLLAQIRSDGSFPHETARGPRALWYQNHMIASLVFMAEVAEIRSQDLYSRLSNGANLHTAIQFLLKAIQDNNLVKNYAKENFFPHPNLDPNRQDLSFLESRGERNYMAWAELYLRRFPEHENSRLLRSILKDLNDSRPLVDEFSGGNTTCWRAIY